MTQKELLEELRRRAVLDNLRCLGCGYEHSCSTHGCAIILAAMEHIKQLAAENAVLREVASPPNRPLTLDELREMDGEPVWCQAECRPGAEGWFLVDANALQPYDFIAVGKERGIPCAGIETGYWLAYRRKPEDVSNLDTIPGEEG